MAAADRPIILGVRLTCPVCAGQSARADELLDHLTTQHRDRVDSWTSAAALAEAAVLAVEATLRQQITARMDRERERRIRSRLPAAPRPVRRPKAAAAAPF